MDEAFEWMKDERRAGEEEPYKIENNITRTSQWEKSNHPDGSLFLSLKSSLSSSPAGIST